MRQQKLRELSSQYDQAGSFERLTKDFVAPNVAKKGQPKQQMGNRLPKREPAVRIATVHLEKQERRDRSYDKMYRTFNAGPAMVTQERL